MLTPEAKVKAKLRRLLEKFSAYYCCPVGSAYGKAGVPDFIVCYRGLFLAIEVKAGKNKPTALQQRELKLIQEAGGFAMVLYEEDLPSLERHLDSLSGHDSSTPP
jgi:Holliday junction resolvase